jgi:hypothetical protein
MYNKINWSMRYHIDTKLRCLLYSRTMTYSMSTTINFIGLWLVRDGDRGAPTATPLFVVIVRWPSDLFIILLLWLFSILFLMIINRLVDIFSQKNRWRIFLVIRCRLDKWLFPRAQPGKVFFAAINCSLKKGSEYSWSTSRTSTSISNNQVNVMWPLAQPVPTCQSWS